MEVDIPQGEDPAAAAQDQSHGGQLDGQGQYDPPQPHSGAQGLIGADPSAEQNRQHHRITIIRIGNQLMRISVTAMSPKAPATMVILVRENRVRKVLNRW